VDWPWCVSSALHRFKPSAIVLVEGEIWPNLTHLAHQLGIPVLMVNGRLSDRGMERRLRLPALSAWPLGRMDYLGMQTQVDADRVLRLGGRPECVEVVGNAKFDQELGPLPAAEVAALRESLGLGWGTRLLLAGSTHRGEESEILDAFVALSKRDQRLRLALAPRETGRIQEVQALVRSRGLSCCFRTRPLPATTLGASTVRVIDTMGELGRLYAAASLAFVGGTLVQVGGHNLLQPVAQGVPVLFGPHTGNTRDVADMLLREGVGFRVEDQSSVVAHASALLEDPGALRSLRGRCLASVERGRGASACYADRILRSLERSRDLGRSPRTQARGPAANALRDDALAR
jgi:3-deoxy-D-manno-octulosonic-acid transferase